MTMTMTMTHSDEVTNGSQKPGSSDVSAGVMTLRKKNLLNLYALLGRQERLVARCIRQCSESCAEKNPTGARCNRFVRIQRGNHADAREYLGKAVQKWNETAESSESLDNRERGFGEKCGRLLHLCGLRSSALEGFTSKRDQEH